MNRHSFLQSIVAGLATLTTWPFAGWPGAAGRVRAVALDPEAERREWQRLVAWVFGTRKRPPEYFKYLVLAGKWHISPWVLERLEKNDETARLWIEREMLVQELWYELNPDSPLSLWHSPGGEKVKRLSEVPPRNDSKGPDRC